MVEYSVCTLYARRFDASPGRNPTGTGASASGHRSHTEEWWWPAWPCRGSTALVICPCPACPDDHSHSRFSPLLALVLPDIILFWSIWFRHSDHGWIHSTLISTVCLVQSSVGLGNSPAPGSSAQSFSHSKLLEFERRTTPRRWRRQTTDQTAPPTTPTSTRALPLGETTGTPADTPGLRAAVHSSRRTSRRVAAGGERVPGERGGAGESSEGCAVRGAGRERARREGERGSGGS